MAEETHLDFSLCQIPNNCVGRDGHYVQQHSNTQAPHARSAPPTARFQRYAPKWDGYVYPPQQRMVGDAAANHVCPLYFRSSHFLHRRCKHQPHGVDQCNPYPRDLQPPKPQFQQLGCSVLQDIHHAYK